MAWWHNGVVEYMLLSNIPYQSSFTTSYCMIAQANVSTPPSSPSIFSLSQRWCFQGLRCVALARIALFVIFGTHIGAWEPSLLVMPALLWFSAERIRGLQGKLICRATYTPSHKHGGEPRRSFTKTNMATQKYKACVSEHVSADNNSPFLHWQCKLTKAHL